VTTSAETHKPHTTKTERVDRAMQEVLHGGHDPSLTTGEQLLYEELAAEMRMGNLDVDGELWRIDYIKEPPSMEQFLLDDYYLGRTWKPVAGENEGIWPAWQDIFVTNLNFSSRIHNMVITGSLGIGKTVMMVTALLYRICLATHLKNPQHFFGLNRNSNIVYNLLSVTKEAVKDTAFGNAMSFMSDSPYFIEVCRYDPDMEYSSYRIPMQNTLPDGRTSHIWLTAGSKSQHVLGRNLIGVGLDEGNFRLEKDPDLKAYALYDEVRTRISNRFAKIASYLPALSVIASSAQDETSFTEKIVKEIEDQNHKREQENAKIENEEAKLPVTEIVFRNAVYKIKRHALTGIDADHHWFRVAYGLKNMEPYILSGWYLEDGTKIGDEPHEDPPSGARTELCPKFYYEVYRRNCKNGLQSLSGISVGGAHRLFPSLIDIEHCLTCSKQEMVPDPMMPGVQRIPVSSEDDRNIWDYLVHKAFLTRVASRIQPIRHPQNLRYAHIDLATQTLAGVAICHLAGAQLVEGLIRDGGVPFSEYRLIVEYDFILTICAGQNKPINIEKIQRFFFWLRDMCGYRFGMVTADMFQCLSGDTLVDTDQGLVPVSTILPGYTVQDVNGLPARVTRNFRYSAAPVLRIITNHNESITGTPNHCLRAASACLRPHIRAQYAWKRLDALKPGDILDTVSTPVCVQGKKREAKAAWLGLYWGDGCLKTGSDNGTISITCAKEHVTEAVIISQKATRARAKVYWSKNGESAEVAIHSRKLIRWMVRNGYQKAPQKSGKVYASVGLPMPILKANRKTQAAFLRGLFSADGGVDYLGTVSLSTKHAELARHVAIMLRTQFGLRSNIVRSYRKGFGDARRVQWIVQVGGSRQIFYSKIGFCFSDKQTKLAAHTTKRGRRLVTRVKRIEHDIADVYDLEVENTHSYTANGFISHNSEMPLQMLEARGFEVDKLSIDKDKSVYTAWRAGFEEHRIRLPRNEQMLREAEQLLEMDKKYDHPPDGSKDTTDAASGAYYNAVNSEEKVTMTSFNAPSVYSGQQFVEQDRPTPPMEIPLPAKGYTRSKVFEA
jgi:LAGLIDADG-like domain/Intein splicing domain